MKAAWGKCIWPTTLAPWIAKSLSSSPPRKCGKTKRPGSASRGRQDRQPLWITPYICHIHEVGEDGDQSFISMEYVAGRSLKDLLAEGPLPLKDALQKATGIAEALGGPQTEHRPPRPEARQHHADAGWTREGDGLRVGQAAGLA